MNKTLLDTDIYSEVIGGHDPKVTRNAIEYRQAFGSLTFSTITVMEVLRGLQKSRAFGRMPRFLAAIALEEVLPFDQDAAEIAGRIGGDLERVGRPIGVADPMIAAVAIAHGLDLATGNARHFGRIRDLGYPLTIVDWRS